MLSVLLAFISQADAKFMRYPDVHGTKVVFTSEGDLWLGDRATGKAQRLTSDAGAERNAEFSPDGTKIAFEAEYDGHRQAYVMPTTGGTPTRLTLVEGFRAVTGWTRDGRHVVFRKLNVPTNYEFALIPATGGAPTKLPLEFASHIDFGPGGDYALTRFNRWSMAWFHYDGGMQNQIWLQKAGKFQRLTDLPGTNEFPVWLGDRIYFVNESKAKFTVMSVDPNGGRPRTEVEGAPLEVRELAGDGKTLVYEVGPDLMALDLETRKVQRLEFEMTSDLPRMRNAHVAVEGNVSAATMTPTGKRVLAESRGQIVSLPAGEGESRVWKSVPGARLRNPIMSPDGKRVAYFSDESGEMQVWVAASDGSGAKAVTKGERRQLMRVSWAPDSKLIAYTDSNMDLRLVNPDTGEDKEIAHGPGEWSGPQFDFSPDSKWLAVRINSPIVQFAQIHLYDVTAGKLIQVSDGRSDDVAGTFSKDGKYLSLLSRRSLGVSNDPIQNQLNLGQTVLASLILLRNDVADPLALKDTDEPSAKKEEEKKDPFRIDLDGLYARRVELPIPAGSYSQIDVIGNKVITAGSGQIHAFDLVTKARTPVAEAGGYQVSFDNTKLLVNLAGKPTVMDISGENKKEVSFGGLRLEVSPPAEWKQIFWDAWRLLRDFFYVENMHGVNWKAIGEKYSAFLPHLRSRDELDELIRWMQAELGSSHQYLNPGDTRDIKPRVAPAFLGVDLEPTPSGYYRIKRIMRGDGFRTAEQSPLVRHGSKVKEGMYLIDVAGIPARVGQDVFAGLVGRAGRTVSIKVNSAPSENGATTLLVTPVASEQRMRYLEWVESNRRYVSERSGGKVGYLHLAAMSTNDMSDFIKQYFPQRDKEALIIDDRFNNGGFIQDVVNRVLNSKLTGFFNMRNSSDSWTRQQDYFLGPMACLMNEFSISCGEEFPHRFRDLKLGPVIGRRTMGGEVGSSPGWSLVDGGVVSVPNYGMWTPKDGWVIEGPGVSPDIDVQSDPNAFLAGRDPQIDRAIEWLLDDLKKNPRNRGTVPKDRVRVGG